MALISGVLLAPSGAPLPNVNIILRAISTSSRVIVQSESTTTTDANGNYSINAETGRYFVFISTDGQPDAHVGTIQIFSDSIDGTLNSFLTMPGENDLTPAIVATVEQMRADSQTAAADALTAKNDAAASETNAAASATDAAKSATAASGSADA
ncbi:prophage tail fiber N-terminal domain-containing protein, partial [Martelella alba]